MLVRSGSQEQINHQGNQINFSSRFKSILEARANEEEEDEADAINQTTNMPRSTAQLMSRQRKENAALIAEIKKEFNDCKVSFDAKLDE